jgi:acyl-CoA thioester hydrolase
MVEGATRVRVRYAETDKMGVVYYANYFVWFEVGRCELLRTLGWTYRDMEENGVSLPVLEASCAYLRPSFYDDELEVRTVGRVVSRVRVGFEYQVVRTGDGLVTATGRTVHAPLDRDRRPCRLPEEIREALA